MKSSRYSPLSEMRSKRQLMAYVPVFLRATLTHWQETRSQCKDSRHSSPITRVTTLAFVITIPDLGSSLENPPSLGPAWRLRSSRECMFANAVRARASRITCWSPNQVTKCFRGLRGASIHDQHRSL